MKKKNALAATLLMAAALGDDGTRTNEAINSLRTTPTSTLNKKQRRKRKNKNKAAAKSRRNNR